VIFRIDHQREKGPNIGAHVGDINVTLLAHEPLLQIVELNVSSQGYSLQVLIVSVGEHFAVVKMENSSAIPGVASDSRFHSSSLPSRGASLLNF
jgi:hypothetical protein